MKLLREDISRVVKLHIAEDGWRDVFMAADVQGKLKSNIHDIVRILCEHVDALENGKKP